MKEQWKKLIKRNIIQYYGSFYIPVDEKCVLVVTMVLLEDVLAIENVVSENQITKVLLYKHKLLCTQYSNDSYILSDHCVSIENSY